MGMLKPGDDPDADDSDIEEATGPYHAFWLFRRDERTYNDYWDLLGRKDAPVRLSDDIVGHLSPTLQWVPTLLPTGGKAKKLSGNCRDFHGLNTYGPTIIAPESGDRFHHICLGWSLILAQGSEPLILKSGWFEEDKGNAESPDASPSMRWKPHRVRTKRDALVSDLRQLADFGKLVAGGEHYLLHLGI